jgi:shikimate dehydrogenase
MKAAVLGSPVGHSLSPALHRAAYAELGLAGWSYERIECAEAELAGLLAGCGQDWAGLSLTMPLKRTVLPLLDRTDPVAAVTGCANTVVFDGGARHGYNTDVAGLRGALAGAGVTGPAAGPALILGAGATACSALACLRDLGLAEVTVAVRAQGRAGLLREVAGRLGLRVTLASFTALGGPWRLLISTLPAGAAGPWAAGLIAAAGRGGPRAVLDVVYHPWPTPLAAAAERAGDAVVSGFEFLVRQAGPQIELMTGRRPAPLDAMRTAGLKELAQR